MPWEATIVNAADRSKPLGDRADVIARFAKALPGVYLQPAPRPSAEFIAQMPPVLQEHYARPPQLNADFEAPDFSIQFYAEDEPIINSVGVEIRGNGNLVLALSALCVPNGWAVIESATDAVVDLVAEGSAEWEKFRAWRDQALKSLKERGKSGDG